MSEEKVNESIMALVPTDVLKRAAVAMSSEETRYYLCGVRVCASGGRVLVQATNGHIAYAWAGDAPDCAPFDVIVPAEAVKMALRASGKLLDILVSASVIGAVQYAPIDGTFPDIRRVFPSKTTGERAYYNPEYLLNIAKAQGKGRNLNIHYNGLDPAFIEDNAFGLWVIMPMRHEAPEPLKSTNKMLSAFF